MAASPRTGWGRGNLDLALVLGLALTHALTHAVVRPLYQVSDEAVYATTVQVAARAADDGSALTCLAPPDGRLPPLSSEPKAGFAALASRQLRMVCAIGLPGSSLYWLRALQAFSLPVVALCAYYLARLLTGSRATGSLAGLLVACHPVAATYAAGITPDAWANAAGAVAFVAATRLLVGRGLWWDHALLIASSTIAMAFKSTASFLVVLVISTTLAMMLRWAAATHVARWRLVAAAMLAIIPLVALTAWFAPPYALAGGLARAMDAPGTTVRDVVADAVWQAPGFLATSWTALGSFGASTLVAPHVVAWIGALLVVGSLAGLVRGTAMRGDATGSRRVLWIVWAVAGLACALQPSIRQVLLDTQDVHQGRWLFPLLAPAAALSAAGLSHIRRGAALVSTATLLTAWLSVSAVAAYYWVRFPTALDEHALFLRATGGLVMDDAMVLERVRTAATVTPVALQAAALLLFLVASSVWYGRVLSSSASVHSDV